MVQEELNELAIALEAAEQQAHFYKKRFEQRERSSSNAMQLSQLKDLPLGTVTENFLLVHANSAGPFSTFPGGVAANFHKLAATAADAQLRGMDKNGQRGEHWEG